MLAARTTLARRLASLALALTFAALVALTLSFGLPLGASTPHALAAGGAGVISGDVRNGTHSDAALAGQQVMLQLSLGSTTRDVATTTTDAQGHFSFSGLDVSATGALGGSYAVYTQFQGGVFSDGPISFATGATQTAPLMVYDATQDSSKLSVSVATILVRDPDVKHGLVGIGEFITMRNSGNTAFVGSLPANGATGGAMPSLLRFSLPPTAQNVTTGVGFFNTEAIQIGSGFAAAATVPPGQTEFAFAYDLPYTGTTLSVPYKAEYPTDQVVTLVPPNMLVRNASGLAAQGIVTAFGARYQVYTANTVAHDSQMAINLYDLPQPGERQDLDTGRLLALAGGLVVALALLLALYLWRGALAATLGLIPATGADALAQAPAPGALGAADATGAAERDRLLREVLALERRHASGALTDEQFKQQDAALRERLRAQLSTDARLATTETETPAVASDDATVSRVTSGGGR